MFQNSMTRRQLLTLAASALALDSKAATQPPPKPRKKGLCLSSKKRPPEVITQYLKSVGARWLYNWNIHPPETLPPDVQYIPMIFSGRWGVEKAMSQVKSAATLHGYTELLGFNEPDHENQGNTKVEKALEEWPKLEANGIRLGSPACVHPDNEWMTAFMKGVDERGLRVDFVCVHHYGGPGVDSFVKKLERVHQLYKRPIWITEFGVGDWEAKSPEENRHKPERIAEFVTELLPRLEAMDFVERYAWFHCGITSNALCTSALFNPDGSLTVVGQAYSAVGCADRREESGL
jgi:Glycosyl hydrolase catalytic core